MKKFYLLILLLCFTTLTFSQNLAVNGDFESWTTGVLDTWTSESGTTIEQYEPFSYEGEYSAKFTLNTQTQGLTDFRQTINVEANKIYTVTVKVYHLDNESQARLYVDGYRNFSDETLVDQWQTITYEYTALATGSIEIGLRFYDVAANWTGAGSEMYIDNYEVLETGAVSDPILDVLYPQDGATVPSNFDLGWEVFNFDTGSGDGDIKITVNGQEVIFNVFPGPTTFFQEVGLGGVVLGANTITFELVDPMGNSLSPQVIETRNITVASTTEVSTLADLRNGTVGSFYKFTGEAVISFAQNLRNQKFIQEDVSGVYTGIKIDDPEGHLVGPLLDEGYVIGSIVGELTEFHGVLQLQPYSNNITGYFSGAISVDSPSYNDILTNWEASESEMVSLSLASGSFVGITPGELFVANTNYTITDGVTNLTFRTLFADADYIGTEIPVSFTALTAIIGEYDATPQVTARKLSDFVNPVLSTQDLNEDHFSVFPNPATDSITLSLNDAYIGDLSISVYSILGKQVLAETVNKTTKRYRNNIDLSNLSPGVYILKLKRNNSVTQKRFIIAN